MQKISAVLGNDLAGSVGSQQGGAGEGLAKGFQIKIIISVEQGPSPDAGEHQGEIGMMASLRKAAQRLPHLLFGSQGVANGPSPHSSLFQAISQG
jgi:hypothetical protein